MLSLKSAQYHVCRTNDVKPYCDRILMLYRDGEFNEDASDPDLTDVFVRKDRHGPTGTVEPRFDRQTMTFREAA